MLPKNKLIIIFLIVTGVTSCNFASRYIFNKKTLHEKYAEKLGDKDLDKTPQGRQWLAASVKVLDSPFAISIPFGLKGNFPPDKPRALGLQFTAKQGERINFHLTKELSANFVLYTDLYKKNEPGTVHLYAADTNDIDFSFDITETGNYIFRLQPEINRTGEYELSISSGPSLAFPVSGKTSIGSYWGDSREGGKRSHEGIDIFAPKRTPVMAVADGYITGAKDGGIGGKTIWMRPEGKNISIYYAHLDEQLVKQGQAVKKGEVIGLVGNTGNAEFTPPHLHFGVYATIGAIDPFPFINTNTKKIPVVADKETGVAIKLKKSFKTTSGILINANSILVPLGVTSNNFIAELPGGQLTNVPFANAQIIKEDKKLKGPVNAIASPVIK